ncbi:MULTISPECIES: hypothetical protein [Prauserella salsuginis group]|uniref:Uncharacterized protein n=1 Tax=Prauserella salsuginis TaxID=387889 RepID=A0ABW6G277_9PSEU|nr:MULTISPECIES: hypothetical protein [Prauserella salsuginis group]MCR3719921.1 hypothetical protein [Prauserella flava]MCR3736535.1 hypothetical protein [Prauserella salsuginis]
MGKKNQPLVHLKKHKSWWSGRITALCGATAEAGEYETETWRLFKLPGPRCPACDRIHKEGKR